MLKSDAELVVGKGVINDERNAVSVCYLCELFYIEDGKRGICDRLSEERLCVLAECRMELLLCRIGRNEGELYSHSLHRNGEEIIRSAVDRG